MSEVQIDAAAPIDQNQMDLVDSSPVNQTSSRFAVHAPNHQTVRCKFVNKFCRQCINDSVRGSVYCSNHKRRMLERSIEGRSREQRNELIRNARQLERVARKVAQQEERANEEFVQVFQASSESMKNIQNGRIKTDYLLASGQMFFSEVFAFVNGN